MKKSLILLFFILGFSFPAFSQFVRTDLGVYPEPPPPPLPPAGDTLVDPIFGTSILRVTDANDGTDNHQSYSYWPSFNLNSTLLYVSSVGGNPTLYDFDTIAFSISNKRALFQSNPPSDGMPNAEDAIWSGTQENVMLCHTGQKLYRYDVVLNQYTLIHDFSIDYPTIYLAQMSRSIDDDVFAFTFKENINYTNLGFIDYRASNNLSDTGTLSTLDEVQVDKSGNYLVIKTGNSGPSVIEVEILNLQTSAMEYLSDNGPDFSPGHSDNGTGSVIGADNWMNRYLFRALATPHQFITIIDHNNDWSLGDHASMLADDESWILFSTFVANTLPSSGIFVDELYQVSTDGNQSVRRLVHTHSDVLNQNSNDQYWSMPRANISRNGKFAVFTSNWGSTTRRDVFVLMIPPIIPTGISETNYSPFEIFPVPATEYIELKFPSAFSGEKITVEVLNSLGQKFLSQENNIDNSLSMEININSFPAGIYFVKVITASGYSMRKFICTE